MHRVIFHSSLGYTNVTCAWHVTRMGIREICKKETGWVASGEKWRSRRWRGFRRV